MSWIDTYLYKGGVLENDLLTWYSMASYRIKQLDESGGNESPEYVYLSELIERLSSISDFIKQSSLSSGS